MHCHCRDTSMVTSLIFFSFFFALFFFANCDTRDHTRLLLTYCGSLK
jgi:hypothetical protein